MHNDLSSVLPKPSAELLEKKRRAVSWAKHRERVDVRHVDALVEQVDGEDDRTAAGVEITQALAGVRRIGCLTPNRQTAGCPARRKRSAIKRACFDAHAKAECPHARRIGDLPRDLLDHPVDPEVVGGQDLL